MTILKMRKNYVCVLVLALLVSGCAHKQAMTQTEPNTPNAPTRTPQEVRQPLPPPTRVPLEASETYEKAELESVLPGSSNTFDPFTYGRTGSPYGPGKIFASGIGARCGPMTLPMSAEFADPGDSQAVIIIAGNGLECGPDIDHDRPGAAITFPLNSAIFINPPWTIRTLTATTVTITNRSVTMRFTYKITAAATLITRVEYL